MREDLLGVTVIKIKNLSKENYPDKKFRFLVRQELEFLRDKIKENQNEHIRCLEMEVKKYKTIKQLLK